MTAFLGWEPILACFILMAAPPACDEEPVHVTVLAILGHDRDEEVNWKIKSIAKQIHKKVPELTGFILDRVEREKIPIGQTHTFKLVDDTPVEVKVEAKEDGRICLTVKPPKTKGSITYSCSCGKFFPVLTDHTTKANERLIIAVMAKPCRR